MRAPILAAALFIGIFLTTCGGSESAGQVFFTTRAGESSVAATDQGERWSGDSWPLTVDAGVLGCEGAFTAAGDELDSVWFEVEGVRYGINGFAVSHYGPIQPIWADDPELPVFMDDPKGEGVIESGEYLKKNIGVLLNPGLELC